MLAHEGFSLALAHSHHPESRPRTKRDAKLGMLRAITEQGAHSLPRDRYLNLQELQASMAGKGESLFPQRREHGPLPEWRGSSWDVQLPHRPRGPSPRGGRWGGSMLQILSEHEPGKPTVRELVTELNDAERITTEPMLGLGSSGVYARAFISRLYLAYGRFSLYTTVKPSLVKETLADLELRPGWLEDWLAASENQAALPKQDIWSYTSRKGASHLRPLSEYAPPQSSLGFACLPTSREGTTLEQIPKSSLPPPGVNSSETISLAPWDKAAPAVLQSPWGVNGSASWSVATGELKGGFIHTACGAIMCAKERAGLIALTKGESESVHLDAY